MRTTANYPLSHLYAPPLTANVNKARQISLRAQMFNSENEIARNAGEIAFSDFIQRYRPGAALDDDFSATQSRHLRRHPKDRKSTRLNSRHPNTPHNSSCLQ